MLAPISDEVAAYEAGTAGHKYISHYALLKLIRVPNINAFQILDRLFSR